MSIFGCKTASVKDAIREYVGEDKLTSFGDNGISDEGNIVGGMIIVHPCREAYFVEDSKNWFTIYKRNGYDIDYSGLEDYLKVKCANVCKIDVFKNEYECIYIRKNGSYSYAASYGAYDEVVVY